MRDTDITADVLVIGCGIAGASAALEAAKAGLRVAVVTQSQRPEESNTWHAQGGIVSQGPRDDPELLRDDIITAGDGVNDPEAVDILVGEGHDLVEKVLCGELEIPFTRSSPDKLDYAQEAGHSRRRILHVDDATGRTIEERFLAALEKHANVTLFPGHTAVDLLTVPHHSKNPIAYYHEPRAIGAYVLDNATRRVSRFFAPHTVLATGGCGAVFLHTSNPSGAIGAGYAMALRAGARIVNMEYIQFHPTVLYGQDGDGFLISETVRGEGARLKTRDGRTFMEKYSPLKDLAPARRGFPRHLRGDAADELDLRPPRPRFLCQGRHQEALPHDLPDLPRATASTSPASPSPSSRPPTTAAAASSSTGWAGPRSPGLYAVGEVACTGVHGANRLASTSLLEGLVWGTRAGRDIAARFDGPGPDKPADIHQWYYPKKEEEIDPALINQDWLTIRSTMWNYAGIIRTAQAARAGQLRPGIPPHRIEQFYRRPAWTPRSSGSGTASGSP